MTKPLPIDKDYLVGLLVDLLDKPSPSGYTEPAIAFVENALQALGLAPKRTPKGALIATWNGKAEDAPRAITSHVDTLGAMVKELKPNGRLKLTQIGKFAWNTVEGEGCTVFTSGGKTIRGALLAAKASLHIHGKEVEEIERKASNMEVRLDARVSSAEETRDLGLEVGNLVAFDPRTEAGPAGFIRSRYLDDKAGVACILAAVKTMMEADYKLAQRTTLHFSSYEEVGHGAAAGFPPDLAELVAVDVAPVGEGQTSDEFHTTICAKDTGGPYHAGLTARLRSLAEQAGIPHKMDVYPHYGSDAEAHWRAGGDTQVALFGPGVDASHNYERTHTDSLVATAQLVAAYLMA